MQGIPLRTVQDDIIEFLITSPAPQEILDFHASPAAQARLRELLDANREGILTPEQAAELEEASRLNHLFMLLKARAHQAIAETKNSLDANR